MGKNTFLSFNGGCRYRNGIRVCVYLCYSFIVYYTASVCYSYAVYCLGTGRWMVHVFGAIDLYKSPST